MLKIHAIHLQDKQIPMIWDFFELNLFSPVSQGTFYSMSRQILRTIEDFGTN